MQQNWFSNTIMHCIPSFSFTVFENHIKSLIQHCERSELRLHFEWTKVNLKMPKIVHFGEFLKTWSLRSNSVTRHVKSWWKMPKFKCDILSNFQTMCSCNSYQCLKFCWFVPRIEYDTNHADCTNGDKWYVLQSSLSMNVRFHKRTLGPSWTHPLK